MYIYDFLYNLTQYLTKQKHNSVTEPVMLLMASAYSMSNRLKRGQLVSRS